MRASTIEKFFSATRLPVSSRTICARRSKSKLVSFKSTGSPIDSLLGRDGHACFVPVKFEQLVEINRLHEAFFRLNHGGNIGGGGIAFFKWSRADFVGLGV